MAAHNNNNREAASLPAAAALRLGDENNNRNSNDDSRLPAGGALDQQQLELIGSDLAKLRDFKRRLENVMAENAMANNNEEVAAAAQQHTIYTHLMGQVDATLRIFHPANRYGNDNADGSPHLPLAEVLKTTTTDDENSDVGTGGSGLPKMDVEYLSTRRRAFNIKDSISLQKEMAIQQLSSFKTELVEKDHHDPTVAAAAAAPLVESIQTALDQGRVKPIFHALCLPQTFLNHHLSFAEVTVGEVDKERTFELESMSDNLDEAVDENGRAARSVTDIDLQSMWHYNEKLATFAVDLVNTDADMLGEGVECTALQSIPIEINEEDASYLLTRTESRGVVRDIFWKLMLESKSDFVAAITGSPGIGKSWTLFYVLQQALLYDGANVMFFFQKSEDVVLFLRRSNKIYAWYSKLRGKADSSIFKRSDVLVVLDPQEADRGGAQYATGKRKLVYAASNNKIHIPNTPFKRNPSMLAFLGPPLDNELQKILHCLDSALPEKVIADRKKYVGNLVRYILTEKQFATRQAAIKEAVKACVWTPDLLDKALDVEGMSDGQQTVPGILFKVLPKRPKYPESMGYDDQLVEYRVRVVEAANAAVRDKILKAKRATILSYFDKTSDDERAEMGNKVEELFRLDLQNPDGIRL